MDKKALTPDEVAYWDNQINSLLPAHLINRGVVEAAYSGDFLCQRRLGLAFIPFSKNHAVTWLEKAKQGSPVSFEGKVLGELAKDESDCAMFIWWSTKDFSQILGNMTITSLNRAMDATLKCPVFRYAVITPYYENMFDDDFIFDHEEYISKKIDPEIISGSDVIFTAIEDSPCEDDD